MGPAHVLCLCVYLVSSLSFLRVCVYVCVYVSEPKHRSYVREAQVFRL